MDIPLNGSHKGRKNGTFKVVPSVRVAGLMHTKDTKAVAQCGFSGAQGREKTDFLYVILYN